MRRPLVAATLAGLVLVLASGCASVSLPGMLAGPAAPATSDPPEVDPTLYGRFREPLDVDPLGSGALAQQTLAKTVRAADRQLVKKITANQSTSWFGNWNADVTRDVRARIAGANRRGGVAALATYNVPGRHCGTYGRVTVATPALFDAWVRRFVAGLGSTRAVVVVEADAVADLQCLPARQRTARLAQVKREVDAITAQGSWAYIDAGHSHWIGVHELARRLKAAGIDNAAGFALNDGNTWSTEASIRYGTQVSKLVGDAHFVVDTSRNGVPRTDSAWCNPVGAGLGHPPTTQTSSALVDAYLWIKNPGVSDGRCRAGTRVGTWMQDYALHLAQNASF